jgi:aminopeptidase
MTDDELHEYARLILDVGLGFRAGKDLAINAHLEHAPLARAVCEEAYARGADYVDIWYWDPHGKASRLRHAPAETLARVPSWLDQRYQDLGERQGALVNIVGDPDPDLLAGIDPARAGLDRMPGLASRYYLQTHALVEWAIACYPTPMWAERVLGVPDADALWDRLRTLLRLDTEDPVNAWRERMAELDARCARLNDERFDAIHLAGPGTDLLVGLGARHRWGTAEIVSRSGIRHIAALPTEEIFTTPDPQRTAGTVRASMPLSLGGTIIRDLELHWVDGRIVEVSASTGADVVRANIALDDGANRLGELALVDDSSRIQQSGLLYYDTLLDESAASHLAWGSSIPDGILDYDPTRPETGEDLPINHSGTHVDFMFGGASVDITGIRADGAEVPVMAGNHWVL